MSIAHKHEFLEGYLNSEDVRAIQKIEEFELMDMLDNFRYSHLPQHLQDISRPFHEMAERILTLINVAWLTDGAPVTSRGNSWNHAQTMLSLNYLLMAKDAAVRAYIKRKP